MLNVSKAIRLLSAEVHFFFHPRSGSTGQADWGRIPDCMMTLFTMTTLSSWSKQVSQVAAYPSLDPDEIRPRRVRCFGRQVVIDYCKIFINYIIINCI